MVDRKSTDFSENRYTMSQEIMNNRRAAKKVIVGHRFLLFIVCFISIMKHEKRSNKKQTTMNRTSKIKYFFVTCIMAIFDY